MANNSVSNTSLPSTNWRYIKTKIEAHPQGTGIAPKAATGRSRKRRRDLTRRTQLTITYRGGPEASYLVCYETRCFRYPGWMALHDVMTHVCSTIAAQ